MLETEEHGNWRGVVGLHSPEGMEVHEFLEEARRWLDSLSRGASADQLVQVVRNTCYRHHRAEELKKERKDQVKF